MNEQKVVAILPARCGSKRIKKKYIRNIYGKPMIDWTIDDLKKCKFINDVIVSTDDLEIKEHVENIEISVPFLRPKKLSDDFACYKSI